MTLQETAFPNDPGGSKAVFDSLCLFCASYTQHGSCGLAMVCAMAYLACRLYLQFYPFEQAHWEGHALSVEGLLKLGWYPLCYLLQGNPDCEMWRTHLLCHPDCSTQTWTSLPRFINSSWLPHQVFSCFTFFRGLLLAFLCSWWELHGLSFCGAVMTMFLTTLPPLRADTSSASKQNLSRLPFQGAHPAFPSYHINRAKTVPQLSHFSRKSQLYLAFFVLGCEGFFYREREYIL